MLSLVLATPHRSFITPKLGGARLMSIVDALQPGLRGYD